MIVLIDSAPTEMLATTLMSRPRHRQDDPAGCFLLCARIRHFLRRHCPGGLLRVVLWLINATNIGHAQVSRPRRPCHQLEANRKESNARTRCVLFSPQRAPFDRHFGTSNAILPARESTTYLQRERGFSAASSFIICIIIHEHSDVAPWSTTDNCIICRHCRPHTSSSGAFLWPNGVA